jgi:hypothetical protein
MPKHEASANIGTESDIPSSPTSATNPNDKKPQTTAVAIFLEKPQRKWKSYIWDTFDKSPEERKFLFKLDAALLAYASLGYFIKYLDQSNINNAFVSGMKEDLGLYKNQLKYMQTAWTVGYVIGEIPSNILLTRIRPSRWIPTMEIIWSVLTMCLSRCSNAKQMSRREHLLSRHAVCHWFLVPERRACQMILHLPHEQCYRHHDIRLSHGCRISSRR